MAYLVDTNIVVDVTRGNAGGADYLDGLGGAWSISTITCLELLVGARSQRETADLDHLLSGYRAARVLRRQNLRALARVGRA